MKKFIAGFVTCAILLFSILSFGFADDILNVVLNPYPVYVNGSQVSVVGYNINGFTFLKLADIGKCFDSSVKFNETDKRIEINSNPSTATAQSTISPEKTTPDGIDIQIINGVEYIKADAIKTKHYNWETDTAYAVTKNSNGNYSLNIIRKQKPEILIDNITVFEKENPLSKFPDLYVECNYYINAVLPIIQNTK